LNLLRLFFTAAVMASSWGLKFLSEKLVNRTVSTLAG